MEHGLQVSGDDRKIVTQLSQEHHKRFSFRYFRDDTWSAPSLRNVSSCCRALLTEIQGAVYAANEMVLSEENLILAR
jgi:hypothetical protein